MLNKIKKKISLLFNPFKYVAGVKSLIIGLIFMVGAALLANKYNVRFKGMHYLYFLDRHIIIHFLDIFLPWVIITILVSTPVLFIKKGIRVVDIAGTLALSNSLTILMVIVVQLFGGSGFSIVLIAILMAWRLVLFYNAIKVSTGIRNTNLKVTYFYGIMSGAVLSRLLLPILTSFLISNLGLAQESPNTVDSQNQTANEEVIKMKQDIARNIVEYLNKGNFERVRLYFDKNVKSKMSVEKLEQVWKQVENKYGKLNKVGKFKDDKKGSNTIIYTRCLFGDEELTLRFTFNDKNQIAGFFFRKPN